MKFRLMSDLHLEFQRRILDFTPVPLEDDKNTVLLLAGDIATGVDAEPFILKMSEQFLHVAYVLGNHEFYGNEFHNVKDSWAAMRLPANCSFLDDKTIMVGDVRVLGGTLWTDFHNSDWFSMQRAKQGMNDYEIVQIKDGVHTRRLRPEDTVLAHKATIEFLKRELAVPFPGKTLVMSHHLPHIVCVDAEYRGHPLNPAYMTDLDYMMQDFKIDAWVHGHTHTSVDATVHNTRILCNPRGYFPRALNREFDDGLTFDL